MARDCTEPRNLDKVQCRNCDEFGHMSKECPKPRDSEFRYDVLADYSLTPSQWRVSNATTASRWATTRPGAPIPSFLTMRAMVSLATVALIPAVLLRAVTTIGVRALLPLAAMEIGTLVPPTQAEPATGKLRHRMTGYLSMG